ncbi:MAG: carboxypeptidase regulatory-like domain-containing protein [Planctomycetes bacterium]|nr:carboxypeptidase regulatory-like domain-containing protein [Planctomycetota bacterium]
MSSRRWLVALVLLALGAVVVWQLATREPPTAPATRPVASTREAQPAGELIGSDVDAERRAEATSSELASSSPNEPAPPNESDLVELHGRLLEAEARTPVAGATLRFGLGRDREAGPLVANTDEAGRFTLSLAPTEVGSSAHADAKLAELPIFAGLVRLEPELVLLARTRLSLRGVVEGPCAPYWIVFGAGRGGAIWVELWSGSTTTDAAGRFEFVAAVDRVSATFELNIACREAFVARRLVPTSELVSPDGARIALSLDEVALTVLDGEGGPVDGAEIQMASIAASHEDRSVVLKTDSAGRARGGVPEGELELCIGAPGFVAHVERIAPPHAARTVHLRRFAERDVVRGTVELDDGTPVAAAFVSARPGGVASSVAVPAIVGMRTDEHGRFELNVGCDGPLVLHAFHREFGASGEVAYEPDGEPITLRIAPHGAIVVHVDGRDLHGPFASGAIEGVLTGADGKVIDWTHGWSLPLEFSQVPPGDYRATLIVRTLEAVGSAELLHAGGEATNVMVPLRAATWASGRLRRSDGSPLGGARLVVEPSAFGERLAATSGVDGSFRVLLDVAPNATLSVRVGERELGRFPLHAGDVGALECANER